MAGDPPGALRFWDGRSWGEPFVPRPDIRFTTPVPGRPMRQLASLSDRYTAYLYDGLLLSLLVLPTVFLVHELGVSSQRLVWALVLLAGFGIYVVRTTATSGGTPGQLLRGLRVVSPDGSPIGWGRATVRSVIQALCGAAPVPLLRPQPNLSIESEDLLVTGGIVILCAVFVISVILVHIDPDRRAPWDRLANTRVVHARHRTQD